VCGKAPRHAKVIGNRPPQNSRHADVGQIVGLQLLAEVVPQRRGADGPAAAADRPGAFGADTCLATRALPQ
jgi:hypothetical protein